MPSTFDHLLWAIALEYAYTEVAPAFAPARPYKTTRRAFARLKWVERAPWLKLGGDPPRRFQADQ